MLQACFSLKNMSVVVAKIQTVDDIYRLVWTAVSKKKPIEATYDGRRRLLCPHRLGRNREGQIRVLCYQYGGGSQADYKSRARQRIGGAWYSRNSVTSNCSRRDGALRRIIPALHPAWSKPILTQRIEPNLQNNTNANRKEHITGRVRNPLNIA